MLRWLLERIVEFDKQALLYCNSKHTPVWDNIMSWIAGETSWIPLYVILMIVIIYRERPYRFIITIVFIAITVALCDRTSVLIKNLIERPRPSHDPEIADLVILVNNYKGGVYGFVSSHAANVFGAATFLTNQFKHYKWSFFLFAWAIIVSYSRIYQGVHYPLDIICGATLGVLIGIQCYIFKVKTAVYIDRRVERRQRNKKLKIRNS